MYSSVNSQLIPEPQTGTFEDFLTAVAMLEANPAYAGLKQLDEAFSRINQGEVDALESVFEALETTSRNMNPKQWGEFAQYLREAHDLVEIVNQDPMTCRALEKPRGYAGDAVMMDYLYGIHSAHDASERATGLGRQLYRLIQERPAGEAVRFRRQHIAGLIDAAAKTKPLASVLSVAAGHLREAELSEALRTGRLGKFIALDADASSMREVAEQYGCWNVETRHGSVRDILARKLRLGQFDFVYAAGLYDYLEAKVAQALTGRLFEMTAPGGQMLVPNFTPQVQDRAYMEAFMDWRLIYRDERDMEGLLASIDPNEIAGRRIYRDPGGAVVYLSVRKAS